MWADTCDCAPGYYGQSCTAELCGDGAQSHSEICDDGNAVGNDGCVRCDRENNDPALVELRRAVEAETLAGYGCADERD